MTTTIYNPLSDMNQIKDRLITMFGLDENIIRLIMAVSGAPVISEQTSAASVQEPAGWYGSHCFDTSYIEGTITEGGCAIYVDTVLAAMSNSQVREVTVEISVICHKGAVKLSEEDQAFCNSIGIYGNRIDCLCQMIHASILSQPAMKEFAKNHAISSIHLSAEDPVKITAPEPGFYGKTLAYTYHTACQAGNAGSTRNTSAAGNANTAGNANAAEDTSAAGKG